MEPSQPKDYTVLKQQLIQADKDIESLDRQIADKRAMLNILGTKAQELEKELTAQGVDVSNLDAWIQSESEGLLKQVKTAQEEMSKINI